MKNEMPKTTEEWFNAIGKKAKVYAEIENRISLTMRAIAIATDPDNQKENKIQEKLMIMLKGEIYTVFPEDKTYKIRLKCGYVQEILMEKTEAFEFI